MNPLLLLAAAGAYLLLLFAVAWWGDRRAAQGHFRRHPVLLSLALGVYATSWTYYGAVGQAAVATWDWIPIYLGPVLVFWFGQPLLRRIVTTVKEHHLTSLADLVAMRYGGDARIGALITLIAVLAVLPYIALQLKAVVNSFQVLAPSTSGLDVALLTAGGLGFFAVLFGTRHVAANERQSGLLLAVALESVIKLSAFVIVAVLMVQVISEPTLVHPVSSIDAAVELPSPRPFHLVNFAATTLVAALAIVCLPRQFHLLTVESDSVDDLRTARWVLPIFLIAISAWVLPLASRGMAVLGPGVNADTYVLQLPLQAGSTGLALLAFIGGFSAATAMVIVSSIALAIMVSNEWVMPRLLARPGWVEQHDLGRVLVNVRRGVIAALLMASYLFYQWIATERSLASLGMVSFVGIAQLAPPLFAAIYWRGGNRAGILSGLCAGALIWAYTLLLPAFFADADWLQSGPAGLSFMAPQALFGVGGLDPVTHAILWSLSIHVLVMLGVSRMTRTALSEHLDTQRFEAPLEGGSGSIRVADLRVVIERFYGADRSREWVVEYEAKTGLRLRDHALAPKELVLSTERRLAAAMGASSARSLLSALETGSSDVVREVARAIEQASGVARFNRDLLQATLDSLSQAVSVVDSEQRLVAWNHAYERLFQLPDSLLSEGEPIEHILRFNAARGLLGEGDAEENVQRRIERLRSNTSYRHERQMPDGTVLDVRGDPMPGGGFVTTFTDVTDFIHVQQELEQSNLTLEARVLQRTQALEEANAALQRAQQEAETANRSKTRFLAAAGHDLMQPLNAARLFMASVLQSDPSATETATARNSVRNAEQALESMEALLSDLLDISRLDAGVWEARRQPVLLKDMLDQLCREFRVVAEAKGLELRSVTTDMVVDSDPVLLRRILQNLVSNALRYTQRGRVLIGVRRAREAVRIEVWDTGPGIAQADQQQVFEEFSRLPGANDADQRGFGLGLAICARMAQLLNHQIRLRSTPGKGSCFSIEVPQSQAKHWQKVVSKTRELRGATAPSSRLTGMRVLCIDNEPQVLAAMQSLLMSWGCEVRVATDTAQALKEATDQWPQVILADYQLDAGEIGVDAVRFIRRDSGSEIPAILITAEKSRESAEAARAVGMRVLRKPVRPAALRALLSRVGS